MDAVSPKGISKDAQRCATGMPASALQPGVRLAPRPTPVAAFARAP